MDRRSGQGAETFFFLPAADEEQRSPQSVACLDGQIQPFVGSKSRHGQVEIFAWQGGGMIEVGIDGRIDDSAIAVIAFGDAALYRLADGNEVGYAFGSTAVPLAEAVKKVFQQPSADAAEALATEVSLLHVPGVAHGRETITDMRYRRAGRSNRFGDAVAKADDQVAGGQAPAGCSRRHQRQQITIIAVTFWE